MQNSTNTTINVRNTGPNVFNSPVRMSVMMYGTVSGNASRTRTNRTRIPIVTPTMVVSISF
ncbi:hypothetical protein VB779_16870 [Haloarculaceae archaeon H-GB11]|nr:hypothetical protein [Haloarculaceae archaeon H-GB11]